MARMKNEIVRICCPFQSCEKRYGAMKNWRKHFRRIHGPKLADEAGDDVEGQLRVAEEKIKEKMSEDHDNKLISFLERKKKSLQAALNRVLRIRASQKLIRRSRRSIKFLRRKN